ncbi:MAG TPA: hypothetical protein VK211_14130 [Kamptonema sp.]|nr:hypothetical protein [Kamptonema sp.]
MQSFRQTLPETKPSQIPNLQIPSDIILSFATVPLLVGLLAGRAAAEVLASIGSSSEELFRGDRLPVLNFPHEDS